MSTPDDLLAVFRVAHTWKSREFESDDGTVGEMGKVKDSVVARGAGVGRVFLPTGHIRSQKAAVNKNLM